MAGLSSERRSDEPSLRGLDVDDYIADPARKQRFVTPMFDIIAPRYDRFTRVFSFGMDRGWKSELMAELPAFAPAGFAALDLACGTGDLAFAIGARLPDAHVLGIDASSRMIDMAEERRRRARNEQLTFRVGDMASLELPSESVDVVTVGYGLRNVPNYQAALREIARVLRPGGLLLTLDFYRPESAAVRRVLLAYLSAAGNLVGWLWHREPVVYGYIARSIEHFVSWQRFSSELTRAGFVVDAARPKLLGGIALHCARRG
jgi:demethylmenaquinone methyltransferase / 2-methoxy-6-polyprenyl-1,4-benzoquinol methylase